jgi:hypothetical protein
MSLPAALHPLTMRQFYFQIVHVSSRPGSESFEYGFVTLLQRFAPSQAPSCHGDILEPSQPRRQPARPGMADSAAREHGPRRPRRTQLLGPTSRESCHQCQVPVSPGEHFQENVNSARAELCFGQPEDCACLRSSLSISTDMAVAESAGTVTVTA